MTNARNIKVWICIACMASSLAAPAPSQPITFDIIDMAAISRMTPQQLEALAEGLAAEEIMRTKRSSAQALTSVVSKASSGIQSKLGFLGQASAGASSLIASASSKTGHSEHTGYSYEPHEEKYDYVGLKKSILYTLFQAVKAITGGVTILKGQLIKGGGALAATLGKVISGKGDAVSNFGRKIVASAALSEKKPHSTAVYGPPPTSHLEYAPTVYGAPTAPAQYSHSAPTGYAAHKYPSNLDGRGKLSGVHAGLVILAPVGDASTGESHPGYTPLEPPPSILNSVYSAIKGAFSSAAPSYESHLTHQEPPLPQPIPSFRPMSWGAVDSYGEPAMVETYSDYDPRTPHSYNYASSKKSVIPPIHKKGLTPEKIQKINKNLDKVTALINEHQRSAEVVPKFNEQYAEMVRKGQIPFLPTPVVSDNEIGVLPAELLPDEDPMTSTSTTTISPNKTDSNSVRRKKDTKYILRGNKIVEV
ncbi:uncharacterized protein LOC125063739 isoform X1 [Pieris napi]|uniref:uncharacterized protein LOC125063739 isoform X1 n=1 Tax=Pieris napi TaxID=78633 RepID=UPI001FB9942C|nr:uncharacterized protein LOC125063739 isoform X1 [Pieris napi]